jgi:hypothetical protein
MDGGLLSLSLEYDSELETLRLRADGSGVDRAVRTPARSSTR